MGVAGSNMERQFYIVVSCAQTDSNEGLTKTCESVLKYHQKESKFLRLAIWCINCPPSLVGHARHFTTNVIDADVPIFCNLPLFMSHLMDITDREVLLFCSCGVFFEDNYIHFLSGKIDEYAEEETILSAFGIRLFPHQKLQDVSQSLVKGIHWKLYNDNETDRQVHIFCPNMCIINFRTLSRINKHYNDMVFSKCSMLWQSYVASGILNPMVPIWKIQTTGVVDFSGTDLECSCNLSTIDDSDKYAFERFYSFIYQSNWPKGIADPIWCNTDIQSSNEDPETIWQNTFGGVNMSIDPASELDFAAAAAYGVKVIRVGAVCDAKDLNYLLDPHSSTSNDDKCHLLKVLPRLRSAILKANKYGLKLLITMADLPGCNFHSGSSSLFWDSPVCRSRAAEFWGYLAQALTDLRSGIMGYDPINEPYTTEDTEAQYFDDMPMCHADELHTFYCDAIREIRKYDQQVKIVVKGLWFASPRAIESVRPLSDSNVVYAFHMYAPPFLTLQRRFGSPGFSYPGFVPRWLNCRYGKVEITRTFIHDLLKDTIHKWQSKHRISSNQILVAEFGICREIHGACDYLNDVIATFQEFKWNWLLFSFRDDEWDALDYELGPDINNMLYRSRTQMFLNVAKHFH